MRHGPDEGNEGEYAVHADVLPDTAVAAQKGVQRSPVDHLATSRSLVKESTDIATSKGRPDWLAYGYAKTTWRVLHSCADIHSPGVRTRVYVHLVLEPEVSSPWSCKQQ